jgi:hypothetical protein
VNNSQLYTCVRTGSGPNDFALALKSALSIPTRDSRSPFIHTRGPGHALPGGPIRLPDTRPTRHRTLDYLLNGNDPVTRISLGTTWDGGLQGVRQRAAELVADLQAGSAFVLGEPLTSGSLDNVIELGRVWNATAQVTRDTMGEGLSRADRTTLDEIINLSSALIDTARGVRDKMTTADRRQQDNVGPQDDPYKASTGDARTPSTLFANLYRGGISPAQYQEKLRQGRQQMASWAAPTPAAKVSNAADYAATLAAGRARMNQ